MTRIIAIQRSGHVWWHVLRDDGLHTLDTTSLLTPQLRDQGSLVPDLDAITDHRLVLIEDAPKPEPLRRIRGAAVTPLADEQVRWHADPDWRSITVDKLDAEHVALAREVQAWRALVNGGPCANGCDHGTDRSTLTTCNTCDGKGHMPGLIADLDYAATELSAGDTRGLMLGVARVEAGIADLRRMVEP